MACSSFAAEEKSVPEAEGGSAWPQPARDRASAALRSSRKIRRRPMGNLTVIKVG